MGKKVEVEWEDVQGIVLSGYGELKRSAYLLWRFQSDDLPRKRKWLSDLLTRRLTPSRPGPSSKTQPARNLALTRLWPAASRGRPIHAQLLLVRIPRRNGSCAHPGGADTPPDKCSWRPRRQFARAVELGRLERGNPRNRRPPHAVRGGGGNRSADRGRNEGNGRHCTTANQSYLGVNSFPKRRSTSALRTGFLSRRSRAARKKAKTPIPEMGNPRSSRAPR